MTGVVAAASVAARRPYGSPNWANITGVDSGDNSGSAHTALGTRNVTMTASSVSGSATCTLKPVVNGVPSSPLTISNGANATFSHPVGQSLYFQGDVTGASGNDKTAHISITVGGVEVDTFEIDHLTVS